MGMSPSGNSKQSRRLKISSCGFSSLFVFFFTLGSEGFSSNLDFSASVIKNFMKSSGSNFPATRFLDSPWDSFPNSEYLTYKLPLHVGPFPAVSRGLSTKQTVHWDTKGSLMLTISFLTLPRSIEHSLGASKRTIESLCSHLGLKDI